MQSKRGRMSTEKEGVKKLRQEGRCIETRQKSALPKGVQSKKKNTKNPERGPSRYLAERAGADIRILEPCKSTTETAEAGSTENLSDGNSTGNFSHQPTHGESRCTNYSVRAVTPSKQIRPVRLQMSRKKGFVLALASPNGLPVVKVDRATKWGNPFVYNKPIMLSKDNKPWLILPGEPRNLLDGMMSVKLIDKERCIALYTFWLIEQPHLMLSLDELRGKNLACWCKLDEKHCHADVLLGLANEKA